MDSTTRRPPIRRRFACGQAGILPVLVVVAALLVRCGSPTPSPTVGHKASPEASPTATFDLPPQDLPPGWVPAPEPDDGSPPFLVPPPDDFTWAPGAELIPLAPVVTPDATESSTGGGPGTTFRTVLLD